LGGKTLRSIFEEINTDQGVGGSNLGHEIRELYARMSAERGWNHVVEIARGDDSDSGSEEESGS